MSVSRGYDGLKVGILLSWADKILAFVQDGDFVSAISLARDYYLGNVKGNKNGLPEDAQMLRSVVGGENVGAHGGVRSLFLL